MSPQEGFPWSRTNSSMSTTQTSPSSSAEDSDTPLPRSHDRRKRKTSNKPTGKISSALGALGVYTQGISYFNGILSTAEAKLFNHIFSLNEQDFTKATSAKNLDHKALVEMHNMRYLMRVYPKTLRVRSSNFDPLIAWRRGVQMAALNWQTYDWPMQINEAMFAAGSDKTGYVLKPKEMRPDYTPADDVPRKKSKKLVRFSVEIVSAQRLPRPRNLSPEGSINPFVEFEMYCADDKAQGATISEGGVDASARKGESGISTPVCKRTRIIEGNGYDPTFNETITLSHETKYPSLVFARFQLKQSSDGRSYSDQPLASCTVKLDSLQPGYRHLPLYDTSGEQLLFCTLFIKVRKEEIIPIDDLQASVRSLLSIPSSPDSPSQEPRRTDFFRKMLTRTPSERRRRDKDSDRSLFSRTSSIEKY